MDHASVDDSILTKVFLSFVAILTLDVLNVPSGVKSAKIYLFSCFISVVHIIFSEIADQWVYQYLLKNH